MSKFFFSSGCCSGRVRLESDSATTESPKALKRPSNESVLKSEAVALKSDRVAQDSHASRMVFQLQDGVWAMAAFGQFPAGQEQVQQVLGRSAQEVFKERIRSLPFAQGLHHGQEAGEPHDSRLHLRVIRGILEACCQHRQTTRDVSPCRGDDTASKGATSSPPG